MKDDDGFVAVVMVVFAFLALLVLSSCTENSLQINKAAEMYSACVTAQKSTPVDMKCVQAK